MTAHPILLQMKYARIVEKYAQKTGVSLEEALRTFYTSLTYELVSEGVADMHCLSDEYLVEELIEEQTTFQRMVPKTYRI